MIIPTHKITDHAESGISIRRLTPDIVMPADRPLHRDDYFAFCLLTKGEVSINVDFTEHTLLGGQVGCMLPGQVHQYATVREPEGWMMFVDGIHLGEENLRVMQRFALSRHRATDEARTGLFHAEHSGDFPSARFRGLATFLQDDRGESIGVQREIPRLVHILPFSVHTEFRENTLILQREIKRTNKYEKEQSFRNSLHIG